MDLEKEKLDFMFSSVPVYYNGKRYRVEDEGKEWLVISNGNINLFCSKKDLDPCREPYRYFPETFYLTGGIFSSLSKARIEKKVKRFFTRLADRPCPPPIIMMLRIVSDSDMKLVDIVDLLNKFGAYGFGGEIHRQFKWFFPSKNLTQEEKVVLEETMKTEHSMAALVKDEPVMASLFLLPREKRRGTSCKTYHLIGRLEELY